MVKVVVLDNLDTLEAHFPDSYKYADAREKLFKRFWNECGLIKRIYYTMGKKDVGLIYSTNEEINNVIEREFNWEKNIFFRAKNDKYKEFYEAVVDWVNSDFYDQKKEHILTAWKQEFNSSALKRDE